MVVSFGWEGTSPTILQRVNADMLKEEKEPRATGIAFAKPNF